MEACQSISGRRGADHMSSHGCVRARSCLPIQLCTLLHRKLDTTTDVFPINFFVPALLHVALVIVAIAAVVGRRDTCPDTAAHSAYQALRWGIFCLLVLSAAVEICIVVNGLQGEKALRIDRSRIPCTWSGCWAPSLTVLPQSCFLTQRLLV